MRPHPSLRFTVCSRCRTRSKSLRKLPCCDYVLCAACFERWLAGDIADEHREGTDVTAVAEGYVSVTPIYLDMTHYSLLSDMKSSGVEDMLSDSLKKH
jgi:hypothetical protein